MENEPTPAPELPAELTAPVIEPETITFRRSSFYLALMPVIFVLGLAAGYLFWGRPTSLPAGTVAEVPAASVASGPGPATAAAVEAASPTARPPSGTEETEITRYPVPVDDDPFFGPANAPVTIIEFSDYQCPYCKRWHAETYPRLLEEYAGRIRIVYHHFPLHTIHAEARPAAIAANCAGKQNKYWEFHNLLFSAPDL